MSASDHALVLISVSQNLRDYDALLEGGDLRARGASLAEAIGNLILADPTGFNILINRKGLSSRVGVVRESEERSAPDSGAAPFDRL